MSFPRLLLVLPALMLTACGPTTTEVLKQYSPALLAQESVLKSLEPLAAQSGEMKPEGALSPRPAYNAKTGVVNMEFIARPRLKNREAPVEIDFYLSEGGLQMSLHWLKETPDGGGGKAGEFFIATVKRAARDLRYALVYDYGAYTKPVATSPTEYRGGELNLDCHLVDLTTRKTVAFFKVAAQVPATTKYEYKKGEEDPAERLQAWVSSTIWSEARRQLAAKLKEVAGADIEFDKL